MNKFNDDNLKKRMSIVTFTILIIFSMLILRLFYIQIIKHEVYESAANKQRTKSIRIYPARGTIYDRNLIPLTNRYSETTIVIFKELIKVNDELLEYINYLSGYTKEQIQEIINLSKGVVEIPVNREDEFTKKEFQGLTIVDKVSRYHESNLLAHVIGYTKKSTNEGQSGIEKAYDDELKMSDDYGTISMTLDGKNRMIPGIGYTVLENESEANGVKLTIDYNIQQFAENIMDEEDKEGAIVVAEVESGDILAMVSRPNLDQDNIEQYLKSDKNEFYNKAIQIPYSYPPGSVFKVIVLLAALEGNEVSLEEKFMCKGFEEVGNRIVKCHTYKSGGHGILDIREAFYDSCNSTFIQLGKRIGGEKIIDMAKRFGFGEKIGIGLEEENSGNLPEGDELLGPNIANISIGQGAIETTPLQITDMMLTIANDGKRKDMSIVDSIVTENGEIVRKIDRAEDEVIISLESNDIVREFMADVIKKGTAKNIYLDDIGGGGGKTGSAQASLNGEETVHAWFAGYFPEKNPKYVITVLVDNGNSGGKSAAPIFEKLAKDIMKIDK